MCGIVVVLFYCASDRLESVACKCRFQDARSGNMKKEPSNTYTRPVSPSARARVGGSGPQKNLEPQVDTDIKIYKSNREMLRAKGPTAAITGQSAQQLASDACLTRGNCGHAGVTTHTVHADCMRVPSCRQKRPDSSAKSSQHSDLVLAAALPTLSARQGSGALGAR